MKANRWKQVEEIFDVAANIQGSERDEFVRRECGNDAELFQEVADLLEEHDRPSGAVDTPVLHLGFELIGQDESGSRTGEHLGKYVVGRLLGRGGMGEVYAAQDTGLGRKVAIKLVPELFALDAERIRRFRKEANAAARVLHPNVASIYELCEINGENLIVMELVEGVNLRYFLTGPVPHEKAIDIAIEIASALEAAHAVGVIHRDIKPENVILTADGNVKVLDFGLAKLVEPIGHGAILIESGRDLTLTVDFGTEVGALVGTPAYMSPEQIRGADVGPQTDIWSVGVLFYEMLSGQLPFRGGTKIDSIAATLLSEHSPVQVENIDGLDKINAVLRKALSKEKAGRYRDAGELLTDLQALKNEAEMRSDPKSSRHFFGTRSALTYVAGILALITLLIAVLPVSRRFLKSKFVSPTPITAALLLPITEGLVSYWPANGNANDLVGGNNGEMLNGATYRPGVSGKAFSFDGVDDLMQAPAVGLPTGKNDRTISMWVYVDDFVTMEAFFGGYGNFGSFDQAYFMGTTAQFLFVSNWGKGPGWLTPMESGRWCHIAATTDSDTTSLYVDGILVRTEKIPMDTPTGSQFDVGRIMGKLGDVRRLKGAADEIAVYNRSLSAEEIRDLFSAYSDPSGLVSYWPADGNAADIVGGNNGELFNGATYRPGVSGQAFSFDGIDDFLQAPTNGLPTGKSERTVAMWVKVDDFVTTEALFGSYGNYVLEQSYSLGTYGNSLVVSSWGEGATGPALESGKWYHIAATTQAAVAYENSLHLYLDGNLVVKTVNVKINTPAGTQLYCGRLPDENGETRRLKGSVDEIKVYDRALAPSEIHTLYSANKPPQT